MKTLYFHNPEAGRDHVHTRAGAAAGGQRRDHLLRPPRRRLHSPQLRLQLLRQLQLAQGARAGGTRLPAKHLQDPEPGGTDEVGL